MTGFLIYDKPEGITSFCAVNRVKKLTGAKKAGHTGTLDPLATGVLVIALGNASRFIELLPRSEKRYEAAFLTGFATDTLDITGKVTLNTGKTASLEQIRAVLPRFTGQITQLPPMYSAVKKDGIRLYELARKGICTQREPRTVQVYSLKADKKGDGFVLDITCSAGTYVRTIIDDIGTQLGCAAVMTELRRTHSNGFDIKDSVSPDGLEALVSSGGLLSSIIPVDTALGDYPAVTVTQAQAVRFANGGELMRERLSHIPQDCLYVRVYSPQGGFLGLGEPDCGTLKVKRVFAAEV